MADTDSLERIRKALEEFDALPAEKFPSFKAERARQNLESACNPVAIRSLLAREAALREAMARLMKSFPTDGDLIGAQWGRAEINEACAAYDAARAALASTEPTKEAR